MSKYRRVACASHTTTDQPDHKGVRDTPGRLRPLLRMLVPSATAFFSGGCLMILALVAGRLVARSLGSSLYTWTSILGVGLAGLSVGHYLGGRIADRYHARRALAVLFGLSSAACIGMVVANNLAGQWMWLWRLNWPGHVFTHVLLVLLPPTILLGATGPIVAKMALEAGLATGRTIGNVYAWGAVGGIGGTFLAGFLLIAVFGNVAILWLLGAVLLLMAILYWVSCWAMYLWAMVFMALMTMGMAGEPWAQEAGTAAFLRDRSDPNLIYRAETPYGQVAVQQISRRPDTRVLLCNRHARSAIIVNDATHVAYFHQRVYAALTQGLIGNRRNASMLVLGAGGYAFPRYLKAVWPDSRLEVVEIDRGMTKAATAAFGLAADVSGAIVNLDARSYVDLLLRDSHAGGAAPRYDFVYQDMAEDDTVPFPLVTKEFHGKVARLLAEDGVYMVHLPDSYRSGRLLGAVVNTAREAFRHVYVIDGHTGSSSPGDTAVVVAAPRRLDPQAILREHGKHLRFTVLDDAQVDQLRQRCGGILLTDDYAPLDYLLAPVVRRRAAPILARKCFDKARELQNGNQCEQSIAWYHQALEADPALAVEAYEQIGLMHAARDTPEAAVEAFRTALRIHAETGGRRTAIGSVHMHLGILLGRMGRGKEGKAQWAQAVEEFRVELQENPSAVVVWEWLGDTSAALGDYPGASDAFDKAVSLEPRNPAHYQKLARALEFQHRYDEAVAVVRKHVKLMREQGRRDLVTQLQQYIELLQYKKVKR